MAFGGIDDGRLQRLGQGQRAVVAQHRHPGVEGAGHAGGQQPVAGDRVDAERAVMRQRRAGGCRALAADRDRHRVAGRLDQDHRIAAQPVHVRLDHLQDEARGDRGIEGVAALFEYGHAHLAGDPVRRGDDAKGAGDFGTGGEAGRGHGVHMRG
jgi:hypothetical protein